MCPSKHLQFLWWATVRSPSAFRADTEYFCAALKSSQLVGIIGLILSAVVIVLKSKIEEVSQFEQVNDFKVRVPG